MSRLPKLIKVTSKTQQANIGNKARNLASLMAMRGIQVPETWVIPWQESSDDLFPKSEDQEAFCDLLRTHLDDTKPYAVRSSSNIEDASFNSFAGLFNTHLNVSGCPAIAAAVTDVWAGTHSGQVTHYLERLNLPAENIRMAVIIQEMVPPVISGVFFSQNPMTGTSEMVIECVLGEGTALVGEGVTPERWVGRREGWVARPDNGLLPSEIANQIKDEALKIHKVVGKPIDLEWVFDGQGIFWVQLREITTLQSLNIYSNRISKDVMPGMIQPLIWSINVPLINSVWLSLLEELVGDLPIQAEDLAKSFYFRSYFNMGAFGQVFSKLGLPSEGLEMMMGVLPDQSGKPSFKPSLKMLALIPRMLRFLWDKWHFERKINHLLPVFVQNISQYPVQPSPDLSVEALADRVEKLYQDLSPIIYLNVVSPLLVTMFTRVLKGQLKKADVDWEQFDLNKGLEALDAYNPRQALDQLAVVYGRFQKENASEALTWADIRGTAFEDELQHFMARFGHFSDNSNNFTAVPWREDPDLVLSMVRDHAQGSIRDRKMAAKLGFEDLPVKGLRRLVMRIFYQRVRKFTVYRDQVSFHYIYGYGLFRPYILRIAAWMVAEGWLDAPDEIYLLRWPEIKQAIQDRRGSELLERVHIRQREMDAFRDIALPEVIYGEDVPPVFSQDHDRLRGTPTSQGYYQGPVKVIHGSKDFSKVEQGDVIVIPYSDVGWTPLFSRAGAVIAESGGLLSHSSIIAREYQIPAVVSVANCMQLEDGETVSINGFTGEVILLSRGT